FHRKTAVCLQVLPSAALQDRKISLQPVRSKMIILYIRIADKLCISLAHRGKSFREKAVSDFFFAFPDTLAESVFISSEISVKLRTKRPVVQIIFHTFSFPAGRLRKKEPISAAENQFPASHIILLHVSIRKLSRNGTDSRYR